MGHFYKTHQSFLYLFSELLLTASQWDRHYEHLINKDNQRQIAPIKTICDEFWNIICCVGINYIKLNNIKILFQDHKFMQYFIKPIFKNKEMLSVCKYIENYEYVGNKYKESLRRQRAAICAQYIGLRNALYAPLSIHILILLYKYNQKIGHLNHLIKCGVAKKDINSLYSLFKRLHSVEHRVRSCWKRSVIMWKGKVIMNMENMVRCNNPKCNRDYIQYRYGRNYKTSNMNIERLISIKKNKWYKCGGCKMVFYCRRKCQKYDWNRYHHKTLCLTFTS